MGMKFSQGNFPELLNDKLMTSTIVCSQRPSAFLFAVRF